MKNVDGVRVAFWLGLSIAVVCFWTAFAFAAAELAQAATLEVGGYGAEASKEWETEYECSSTQACEVIVTVRTTAEHEGEYKLYVDGVQVVDRRFDTKGAHGGLTFSALVPAGKKWKATEEGVTIGELFASEAEVRIAGAGEPGPEGKEGKEGPRGERGESGGGGGESKTEVTGFSSGAEATLSEGVETVELMGWCIVGTLLALATAFVALRFVGERS